MNTALKCSRRMYQRILRVSINLWSDKNTSAARRICVWKVTGCVTHFRHLTSFDVAHSSRECIVRSRASSCVLVKSSSVQWGYLSLAYFLVIISPKKSASLKMPDKSQRFWNNTSIYKSFPASISNKKKLLLKRNHSKMHYCLILSFVIFRTHELLHIKKKKIYIN